MPKQMKLSAPERLEKKILKLYPTLDEYTAFMLEAKEKVGWPDWCYLPMSASFALVTNGAEPPFAQMYMQNAGYGEMLALSAIIPWRLHKPVYRFDKSVLIDSNELPALSGSLLHRMPYPGIYLEDSFGIDGCCGVFIFLEWDAKDPEITELRAHYLFADGKIIPIYHKWTDAEDQLLNVYALKKLKEELPNDSPSALRRFQDCVIKFADTISVLSRICSGDASIESQPPAPSRRGKTIKTASYPQIFYIR